MVTGSGQKAGLGHFYTKCPLLHSKTTNPLKIWVCNLCGQNTRDGWAWVSHPGRPLASKLRTLCSLHIRSKCRNEECVVIQLLGNMPALCNAV